MADRVAAAVKERDRERARREAVNVAAVAVAAVSAQILIAMFRRAVYAAISALHALPVLPAVVRVVAVNSVPVGGAALDAVAFASAGAAVNVCRKSGDFTNPGGSVGATNPFGDFK